MIIIQQSILSKAWGLASQATTIRSSLPILDSIRVGRVTDDTMIELSATDLTMSLRMRVPVTIEGDDAPVVIPSKGFNGLIRVLPASTISMSVDRIRDDECAMTLTCEHTEIKLGASTGDGFPTLPPFLAEDINWTVVPLNSFRHMIKMTAFAASADEFRPGMAKVFVRYVPAIKDSWPGLLKCSATDGYRLAIASEELHCGTEVWSMLVPTSTLRVLNKIASYADPESVYLMIDGDAKRVTFRLIGKKGGPYVEAQLTSMLPGDKFPDTEALLKTAQRAGVQVVVDKAQMQQSLRIAACFIPTRHSGVKLLLKQGLMTLESSSVLGIYTGEMKIENDNTTVSKVTLNIAMLHEIIDALSDTFMLKVSDPNRPVVFTTRQDAVPAGTYVLMPITN